jgi:hypothetical protein
LPETAIGIDPDTGRFEVAQGVWRIEWDYSVFCGGTGTGQTLSTLRQDPADVGTEVIVFSHASPFFLGDGINETTARHARGSFLMDLSGASQEDRTFDIFISNESPDPSIDGIGGVITLTKVA